MSLKQKLDFMFKEAFPELKASFKDGKDMVAIDAEDKDGFNITIYAYKDGDSNLLFSDLSPELTRAVKHQVVEVLKQKEAWAEVKISYQDINKFSSLVSQMEPENLYMDGEISVKEGEKRLKELKKEWVALEKKIGRKVTQQEVFEWENESNAAVSSDGKKAAKDLASLIMKFSSNMCDEDFEAVSFWNDALVELSNDTEWDKDLISDLSSFLDSGEIDIFVGDEPSKEKAASLLSILKNEVAVASTPKMEDVEKVELYPTTKDMNVEAILTKMNREDGSSYYGIIAVDYMKKGGKDLGHSLITYPSLEAAKKIFEGIKNRVPKAKVKAHKINTVMGKDNRANWWVGEGLRTVTDHFKYKIRDADWDLVHTLPFARLGYDYEEGLKFDDITDSKALEAWCSEMKSKLKLPKSEVDYY